eukprot:CAMPEP_0204178010 /NCGR_PEP_ID=MMETSP0361-20130328/48951_1 /ASSEMBLY_ACC=CAM_ASM_000343 /TAXON_ID=268821 /ORGANISM="Scrippsiella Hangoei, Strain SHTV-5" /LENGTH=47 /DNA_ID= /DNA_START= /DNA_END= /DNA_ORIENTATION=
MQIRAGAEAGLCCTGVRACLGLDVLGLLQFYLWTWSAVTNSFAEHGR